MMINLLPIAGLLLMPSLLGTSYIKMANAFYSGLVVLKVTDNNNNQLTLIKPNQQIVLNTEVANLADEYKGRPATTLTEIRDEDELTLYLSWQSTKSTSEGRSHASFSWTPKSDGLYQARQFVVTDLKAPKALTQVFSTYMIVLDKEGYQGNITTSHLDKLTPPTFETLTNYTLGQAAELQKVVCGRGYGGLDLSRFLNNTEGSDNSTLILQYENAMPQKVNFAYLNPEKPVFKQGCSLEPTGIKYSQFFFEGGEPHNYTEGENIKVYTAEQAVEYVAYVLYGGGNSGYSIISSESEYNTTASECHAIQGSPAKRITITAYDDRFFDVQVNVIDWNSGTLLYEEWMIPYFNPQASQKVSTIPLGNCGGVI